MANVNQNLPKSFLNALKAQRYTLVQSLFDDMKATLQELNVLMSVVDGQCMCILDGRRYSAAIILQVMESLSKIEEVIVAQNMYLVELQRKYGIFHAHPINLT